MPALLLLLMLPAAAQELTTSIVDAGGGLTNGGDVEIAGAFGSFGDLSTGGDSTARAGFPGQIYDPASVAITPGSASLTDNSTTPFSAEVVCDDDSLLPPSAIAWSVNNPLLDVSPAGEVTAGLLPGGFTATLTASASGVTGSAALTVLDFTPDDFGLYAGDGLPDDWQVQHFGLNNPEAAPASDPDSDWQDNALEYLAGTDPLDAASLLELRFGPDDAPGVKSLNFTPFLPDRTYSLEWSDALTAPWTALPDAPAPATVPGEGTFSDAPAPERKFYRLRITVP